MMKNEYQVDLYDSIIHKLSPSNISFRRRLFVLIFFNSRKKIRQRGALLFAAGISIIFLMNSHIGRFLM